MFLLDKDFPESQFCIKNTGNFAYALEQLKTVSVENVD